MHSIGTGFTLRTKGIATLASLLLIGMAQMSFAATGDFNGDGFEDLAIGVFMEDIGTIADAGAVSVLYGTSSGLDSTGNQLWNQDSPGIMGGSEEGDHFGYALASGDFDGDGYSDLAIGAPGEDVGTIKEAGAVSVLYGSEAGLTSADNMYWNQTSPGIEGGAEEYDMYGRALASGDFDGDGYDDLAVGVPGEGVGTVYYAGAVNILYGSSIGLNSSRNKLWHQDVTGVADNAEEMDFFGSALASGDFSGDGYDDLAIGVWNEDIGSETGAGAVNVLYGSASGLTAAGDQIWHQDISGVEDVAEGGDNFGFSLAAGNFDGQGCDDLAIGVPYEDVGSLNANGAVNILYGASSGLTSTGNQFWHQDSPGIRDLAEDGDLFGYALAAGDYDSNGYDDLAIGVPGEEVGTIGDAGAVNVLFGGPLNGLHKRGNWYGHQDSPGISDTAEWYDYFGSSLAAGDFDGNGFDELAVGVPYENISGVANAGAVNIVSAISGGNQFWHQDSPGIEGGIEPYDQFGSSMAIGSGY